MQRWPNADTTAFLTDLRQQLLSEIPTHWFECRRARRLATDLVNKAATKLRELCWHRSELEHLFSEVRRINRDDSLHALLHGYLEDGRSLIGSVRADYETIQDRLSGRPEALTVLEEVEQLLQEADVAVSQILKCDEMSKMDPVRMRALQVIEEILTTAQDVTAELG